MLPFGSGGDGTVIQVDADTKYQTMDGFGASFTDSSAWLVQHQLDDAARDEVMRDLFDPASGIGLSMVRQPMGASDFTVDGAVLRPTATTDATLAHFSIDHDRAYIIPVAQAGTPAQPAS